MTQLSTLIIVSYNNEGHKNPVITMKDIIINVITMKDIILVVITMKDIIIVCYN